MTGVKPLPLDDEIRLFVEYVAEHFYRLSLMEIDNAFNLATSGKLNIDANHYQSFNVIYISSILNAYKDYIGKYILQYRKELEESLKVEPTEQERTQLMIESVLEGFDRFKEERKDNPFGWVSYDFLSRLGVINISNEIKEEIKQQSIEMSLEELKYKKIDTKNKSQRKQISNLIEEITNDISGKQDIVVRNCKNLGLTYYYNYILENNLSLSDEISKCIK